MKIRKGILGGGSGPIGGASGQPWKGIPVIRKRTTNKFDAKTPNQLKVREDMKAIQGIMDEFDQRYFDKFWGKGKAGMNRRNYFVYKNFKHMDSNNSLDLSNMYMSDGHLRYLTLDSLSFSPASNDINFSAYKEYTGITIWQYLIIKDEDTGALIVQTTEGLVSYNNSGYNISDLEVISGHTYSVRGCVLDIDNDILYGGSNYLHGIA